jgi:hypothetical protein
MPKAELPDLVLPDVVAFLPDRVWYLTRSGRDMWCRRPHGFFFTTSETAVAFATAMGTELDLQPIGVASKDLVSDEGIAAMSRLEVTRIFVDPRIDPVTGDVFGKILRIERTAGPAGSSNRPD